MGSSSSQEDKVPLLETDEGIQPVFEELKLVLIGSQGAGKNTAGNAILGDKIFTFWNSFRSDHIKETRTVLGTEIHLTRTPGWRGELSRSQKTKMEIVHCVQSLYSTGPHAVLLALKVDSELPKSTISTLEELLTDELWNHTIVIFTNGEKLGGYTIEDNIRCQQLQPLIDKCGQRYFVVQKNDCNQITDTIEELIIRKNSATCFKLSARKEVNTDTLLSDKICLVERIKSIIQIYNKKLLKSKDDKIKRLKNIVQEQQREIERLQSRSSGPNLVAQHRIAELEHQLNMKDIENEELKKQLQICKTGATECRTHEDQHATYIGCRLSQNISQESMRSNTQIPLHVHPLNSGEHVATGSVHEWGVTLLQILDELSDDQLKTMKDRMHLSKEWKIPRRSMEDKNRGHLVDLIIEKWGERRSVLETRDLMKKIPRNDDVMIELFTPFLEEIGETW